MLLCGNFFSGIAPAKSNLQHMPSQRKLCVLTPVVKGLVYIGQIIFMQHFNGKSLLLNKNCTSLKHGFGHNGLVPLSFIGSKIQGGWL